jgi:hypothetical protein
MAVAKKRIIIERMVRHRLLDRTSDGYRIHNFLKWNPPAAEVKARREADRERKAAGRQTQGRDERGRITSEGIPSGIRTDVRPDGARTSTGPVPVPVPERERREDLSRSLPPTKSKIADASSPREIGHATRSRAREPTAAGNGNLGQVFDEVLKKARVR